MTSNNHNTSIITPSQTYHQPESLKCILSFLPAYFEQCHRSCVLNMRHVMKLQGKDAYMSNGERLPISKPYLDQVQTALLRQYNHLDYMPKKEI